MEIGLKITADSYNTYIDDSAQVMFTLYPEDKWKNQTVYITLDDRTVGVRLPEFIMLLGLFNQKGRN